MEEFVKNHYPQFVNNYFNFKYNVQRWDAIRYLILDKMGGMYVDFDCECLNAVDDFVDNAGKCYFSIEPEEHCKDFFRQDTFNNAIMASCPNHPFFKKIIDHIFIEDSYIYTGYKVPDVHKTTGPTMLTNLYQNYNNKDSIVLWPAELASPWTKKEVRSFINGSADEVYLEKKIEKAFAIHYFFSLWA